MNYEKIAFENVELIGNICVWEKIWIVEVVVSIY